MLDNITADCNEIFEFLQAVAVKSYQIIANPLLLHEDKRACIWLRRWPGNNLSPPTNAPQDHTGLTVFLSDVAMRLQNSEFLSPVVAEQCNADKETKV